MSLVEQLTTDKAARASLLPVAVAFVSAARCIRSAPIRACFGTRAWQGSTDPYSAVGLRLKMATIGGTMATAGDVRKEQAEARVIERRRRLEDDRKMRCVPIPVPTTACQLVVLCRQGLYLCRR